MLNNRLITSDLLGETQVVVPPVDTAPDGCPSKTLGKSHSRETENPSTDDLSGLREWALKVAQDSTKESGLRRDIARLLFGMTTDQLETARAKLTEIFDTTTCPLSSAVSAE